MYAGARSGDYAGDPLDWLKDSVKRPDGTEYICWVTPAKLQIKAIWRMANTLPKTGIVYTYEEGVVVERGSSSPKVFDALIAGVVPKLAAVAVAPAANDPVYDPLCGELVANLVTMLEIPAVPANVMCRNVGNGSVEVAWDDVYAEWYNVYMSLTSDGIFKKINLSGIYDTKVRLPNIKFGTTVYIKVTAENEVEESDKSELAQDAVCSQGITILQFTGMVGDKIPVGALFSNRVNTKLVSFVATTEGICS